MAWQSAQVLTNLCDAGGNAYSGCARRPPVLPAPAGRACHVRRAESWQRLLHQWSHAGLWPQRQAAEVRACLAGAARRWDEAASVAHNLCFPPPTGPASCLCGKGMGCAACLKGYGDSQGL